MEGNLRDVSDRIENVGSSKDTKVVSELMDYIRDAIYHQAVSGKAQTKSGI